MELDLETRKVIVKGNVADYATTSAEIHKLPIEELATILREIADSINPKK